MEQLKILLVDDDHEISDFLKLRLSMDAPHFSISHVETAQDCLDYIDTKEVDCILSDYQLPGINGMELLMELKCRGDRTPFIFITGQGNEAVAREAFKAGAHDYFTKDIGFAHFTRIINSVEQAVRNRVSEENREWAERRLSEEKNKYESILAFMADGISIQDTDFRILYQNPAQKKLIGDHVGRYCYQAYHGGDAVCESCQVAMAFADGMTHTVERSMVKDGEVIHLEVTASPLRDAAGKIVAAIEAVRDISPRKRAERKVEHLNRLYSIISQTSKAILRTTSRVKLMEEACRIAVLHGLFRMAWVGFVDRAGGAVRPVASWGAVEGYLDEIRVSSDDEPEGRGPIGVSIRSGKPFVVNDLENDPVMEPWREKALARGYRSLAAFPIKDEDGVVGAFTVYSGEPGMFDDEETSLMEGLAADISFALRSLAKEEKRRVAEEALREAEEKARTIANTAMDAIVMIGNDGRISYWNPAAERTFGYEASEAVGRDLHDLLMPQRYRQEFERRLAVGFGRTGRVPTGGHPKEFSAFGKDRGEFPVEVSLASVKVKGEWSFVGVIRDITERKAVEEALRESELLFRSLVEESLVGVYIIQDGRFSYVNPRAAEMIGYTREEAVGGIGVLDIVHPDDRGLIDENIRKALSGEIESTGVQFRGVRKDGSILEVEAFGAVTIYKGRPAVIGTALDITGRKHAEEEKSALFHMLTHDIKGPLSVIYGYSDIFRQVADGDGREMAEEIQKAAKRISALIDDMLSLSKLESSSPGLVITPVSLVSLLKAAMRDNGALAAEKGISIAIEADPALPKIHADGIQLTRAFSNLVANAVHYNGKGGSVRITAMAGDDGRVTVEVADNGDGIAAEDMPHLFDKYYRGKLSGKKRGTGLGLAIVKAAIDAHGGSVLARSALGKGSTFTVVLPVKHAV